MAGLAAASFVWDEVVSRDRTRIGFRRYGGAGPGVVLVHGGAQAAQNLSGLAGALAGAFTVCVPDRRGRGHSGPVGSDYELAAECDDLAAVVQHSGARYLFGLSSGGLIVLSAALRIPGIRAVAVYEPPLSVNHSTPLGWLPRFERELARGDLGAAAVTAMRGTRTAGPALRLIPRPLITTAVTLATRDPNAQPVAARVSQRRSLLVRPLLWPLRRAATHGAVHTAGPAPAPDADVPLRALVPTMRHDAHLVAETEGTVNDYRALTTPVLLLSGSRSARYLTQSLDALQAVLPDPTRVELPKAGHTAPDNTGDPLRVATELQRFFTAHSPDNPPD
jgi:alpha-beta hydrolase superfamily lysophospholipase